MCNPLVVLALLVGGCGPLSYVTQKEMEDRLCDLDEDDDGFKRCLNEGEEPPAVWKDCNDDPALGGALETPNPEGDSPEIPYDGYDNDCGAEGIYSQGPAEWATGEAENQLPSGDVIDVDADGWAGIARSDYEAIGAGADWLKTEGITWPAGVADTQVDCDDLDPLIAPEANDNAYDGVDSDCQCDQDFDVDGDGFAPTEYATEHVQYTSDMAGASQCVELGVTVATLQDGDCDDNATDGHLSHPDIEVDDPYDGIDNDCDGANDYDQDGDGWMPAGHSDDLDVYNEKYGYTLSSDNGVDDANGFDCEDASAVGGVRPEGIYPGATDAWYNGADEDCGADNDFDQDGDTWMIDGAAFSTYWSYWFGAGKVWDGVELHESGFNDCVDTDASVHPQAMETVGDAVDQDCDDGVDSTTFAFANYGWTNPRHAKVDHDGNRYLLVVLTDQLVSGSATKTDRGQLLYFDGDTDDDGVVDIGWDADPDDVSWEGGSAAYPLNDGVDLLVSSDDIAFAAASYFRGGKTYLRLHELEWDGTEYNGDNVTFKTITTEADPSDSTLPATGVRDLDLDLQEDEDGNLWVLACAPERAHAMSVPFSSGSFGTVTYMSDDTVGGSTCVLDLDTITGFPFAIFGDGSDGSQSRELDGGFELPLAEQWSGYELADADVNDDWIIFPELTGGLSLFDEFGSDYHYVLDDYDPLDADVMFYDYDDDGDDDLFAAIVVEDQDGDGNGDIVFGYGDPTGTLTEVLLHLGEDEDGDGVLDTAFDAETVALYIDEDRLLIAATAPDAVGWLFMGSTP